MDLNEEKGKYCTFLLPLLLSVWMQLIFLQGWVNTAVPYWFKQKMKYIIQKGLDIYLMIILILQDAW